MEKSVLIKGDNYDIPGVLSYTETANKMPAVILCHGTGAQKNEVGNLFAILAEKLLQRGIASVRIDYAGCGDSKADQRQLTFLGEVEDTKRTCQYICGLKYIDQKNIGILGFSQGARVAAELLKETQEFTCVASWSGACQNGRGAFEDGFRNIIRKQKNTDMQEFLWDGEMISFYQNSGLMRLKTQLLWMGLKSIQVRCWQLPVLRMKLFHVVIRKKLWQKVQMSRARC